MKKTSVTAVFLFSPEVMRKYPTLPLVTRKCTKRFPVPDTDLVIDEGTKIMIPFYAFHHDPKFSQNQRNLTQNGFHQRINLLLNHIRIYHLVKDQGFVLVSL